VTVAAAGLRDTNGDRRRKSTSLNTFPARLHRPRNLASNVLMPAGRVPKSSSASKRRSACTSKGLYANYFEVGHTAFEFVIEFGDTYANGGLPCHTRIVTTPVYATELLQVLGRAVKQYEARFGAARERRGGGGR
jgi:hypothetical protein